MSLHNLQIVRPSFPGKQPGFLVNHPGPHILSLPGNLASRHGASGERQCGQLRSTTNPAAHPEPCSNAGGEWTSDGYLDYMQRCWGSVASLLVGFSTSKYPILVSKKRQPSKLSWFFFLLTWKIIESCFTKSMWMSSTRFSFEVWLVQLIGCSLGSGERTHRLTRIEMAAQKMKMPLGNRKVEWFVNLIFFFLKHKTPECSKPTNIMRSYAWGWQPDDWKDQDFWS